MKQSNQQAISPEERPRWLQRLREQLGRQDIEVYGLDPRTRAARVMVEADYRMKLVAMGLEPGVPGVQSYLASIVVRAGQGPAAHGRAAVVVHGQLRRRDRRPAGLRRSRPRREGATAKTNSSPPRANGSTPGPSDALNRQFAQSFTRTSPRVCHKYPIYGELRNLFDLALVGAISPGRSGGTVGWQMTCFGDPRAFAVALEEAPKEVESVVNCRVVNDKYILAGVSGGVSAGRPRWLRVRRWRLTATVRLAAAAPPPRRKGCRRQLVVGLMEQVPSPSGRGLG